MARWAGIHWQSEQRGRNPRHARHVSPRKKRREELRMIECSEDDHPIRENTIIPSSRNAATKQSETMLALIERRDGLAVSATLRQR
jgi:hypothetical protein